MRYLGSYDVSVNLFPVTISNIGGPQSTGTIIIVNESPNPLIVSYTGNSSLLPAWVVDRFDVGLVAGFAGLITITPSSITATTSPTYQALITAYAPGEQISNQYPYPLVRKLYP